MTEVKTQALARALAKVRRRLLPFLILCYFAAYLDRVNVGFAALTMNADLGIGAEAFGFTAGIFFLGYCLFEVPSNVLLAKVGARVWIARIMITWGIIAACMAFVTGTTSLSILRFCLGVAEAGFFPGIIYYLTHWVPQKNRAAIVSTLMMAVPVSNLIGAPVSGLILDNLDQVAGLKGWQWLFIVEAIPSILLGIAAYFMLTETPAEAAWLQDDERRALSDALTQDAKHAGAAPMSIAAALADRRTLVFCLIYFGIVTSMYGLTLWMPQVVQGFGLSNTSTGLLTAVPYVFAAAAMAFWGQHSDASGERIWHIALPCFMGGMALMAATHAPDAALGIVVLTLAASGIFAALPMVWTLPTAYLKGPAAAAGIALINSVGNAGGFAGPYLVGALKQSGASLAAAITSLAGFIILSGILTLMLSTRRDEHKSPTTAP